jgi:urea carboxylase
MRERIHAASADLCAAAAYRSAGTVEFVYDAVREEVSFLELNARLQVEHPVTEEILGIDLVAWMLRLAGGDASMLDEVPRPRGHAIEVRVYAEDPAAGHRPSPGRITSVELPDHLRVDSWVAGGTEVSPHYDPLLAKVIATGATREEARATLGAGLREARVHGIRTNLGLLRAALRDRAFADASHTTSTLAAIADEEPRIEVVRAGTMTTVQDWPGRTGMWHVGVPPCGPMDDLAFRLGNRVLGNPEGAPGLECTLEGPALRFTAATEVCVTGADARVTLDGEPAPPYERVAVRAGALLDLGTATGLGLRTYVLVAGGLEIPAHLGSAATFTLGNFGGHGGRALRAGDVLVPGRLPRDGGVPVAPVERPLLQHAWTVGVLEGPHADDELFADLETLYGTDWEVHFNSARTGVRLVGPRPRWPRPDGGEAGLHPSNIHDTPYAIGSVDFTGDVPIVLGPDGPSLGGFICPAVVATDERWKLGQARPGDTVRMVRRGPADGGVLGRREESTDAPSVTWRRAGDDNLLVEYGPMTLDLGLRMRVHALAERVAGERLDGVLDLTAGIRSLQIHVDPGRLSVAKVRALVTEIEDDLPATRDLAVPSREVRLPLSWDDPATRLAIERYMANVRPDAPWCPWNIEFIRRVNGLESVDDVHRIVFGAEYLVLGLGDVYLGAPVATPLDPRHRLVTTKYNPARTWTPENAVGIGGAYLCIYGMEGPGGYQFVGRTVQVWDSWAPAVPWLLRPFDRISWYPVGADELLELRADLPAGRLQLDIRPGSFRLADHIAFCEREADGIAAFRARQTAAFAAEREAWAAAGEFDAAPAAPPPAPAPAEVQVPDGGILVAAPLSASVWRVDVRPGDAVRAGDRLLTLEAMKTETAIESPMDGSVHEVVVGAGDQVLSGSALVVVRP